MTRILTLIANPLTDDHVRAAEDAIGHVSHIDWLGPGEACDLHFADDRPGTALAARDQLAIAPVDLFAQPDGANRRKRLLIADMDSTIITVECIDEMADMLGLKPEVSAITERAMRGELDFAEALRARAAMLAGLDQTTLDRVYDKRIRLTAGARTLVQTMRANGAYTALVSGGFRTFTSKVREAAGFDVDLANRLLFDEDRLNGQVAEPILGADAKLAALRQLTEEQDLDGSATLAVGDGANDLPMIKAAGLGVAFHAKPLVAEAAAARIDHGDLTALLYLQGYRRDEFVFD